MRHLVCAEPLRTRANARGVFQATGAELADAGSRFCRGTGPAEDRNIRKRLSVSGYHIEIDCSFFQYFPRLPGSMQWWDTSIMKFLMRGVSMTDAMLDLVAHLPRLDRYARSLTRDRARAEDLVQDTLVRAL